MATVYLARDQKLGRAVALKVLRPELAAALGAERFLREIQIAATLTHPHILGVHDSGEADGILYYTMPFVEGESLRDRLTRAKQLPVEEALAITREVADALSYAHALGLVHRDIKPENILLQAGHAVVADFGIARAVDAAGGERLTQTGLALGTPAYMSPEQAAGEKDLDGRSDVYALGCVLYEMLSGETPYTGPSAQAILAKKLSEPLPRISVVREAVPRSLEAVLAKALARTPADRYATASQFAAALAHPQPTITSLPAPATPWWRGRALRLVAASVVLVTVAAVVASGHLPRLGLSASRHPRTAIAVLPLENLSPAGPHVYFAGGLHDELLTQLAKVAALSVRPRTSVMSYGGTSKPMKVIGDELAVGAIVEGSVQVEGNRLRVNVQLIDPATETHLWAEHYDRTLDDAFAVQSEIAQRIVEAVGTTLTAAEEGAIAAAPTSNAEAYRLYLQGRDYFLRTGSLRQDFASAEQLYARAVALDPAFALAHVALSELHGLTYWYAYDPTPARAARQQEEAETALRLAPRLPQAHFAMGRVHYSHRDWRAALEEYRVALNGLPGDGRLWAYIGYAYRRLGRWTEALVAYQKAVALDPRDADLFRDLGGITYDVTHRYAEAVSAVDRALSLAPDFGGAAITRGWLFIRWKGQLDTLQGALDRMPRDAELGYFGSRNSQLAELVLLQRRPDSLLALCGTEPAGAFVAQESFVPSALYAAWAHQLRGEPSAARAAFEAARVVVDSVRRTLPDDWRLHVARGLALAGLGRRADALLEARWLQQSALYRDDASEGPIAAEGRAQILAQARDTVAALDELRRLLAGPSYVSVHTLQLDPRYDPIRSDARFHALLRRYSE